MPPRGPTVVLFSNQTFVQLGNKQRLLTVYSFGFSSPPPPYSVVPLSQLIGQLPFSTDAVNKKLIHSIIRSTDLTGTCRIQNNGEGGGSLLLGFDGEPIELEKNNVKNALALFTFDIRTITVNKPLVFFFCFISSFFRFSGWPQTFPSFF